MALTNFKLVNTEGVRALHIGGDTIPLEKIDDQLAEQLYGKTHVLERVKQPVVAPATPAIAEPAEPTNPAAEEAAPSTSRRRTS